MSLFRRGSAGKTPANRRRDTAAGGDSSTDDNKKSPTTRKSGRSFSRAPNARRTPADAPDTSDPEDKSASGTGNRFAPVLRLLLLLGILAIVGGASVLGWRHATTSPFFAIQFVNIEGNSHLSNAEILTASGIEMGTNIFSVDLAHAEANLRSQPWVLEANLSQQLPRTIAIEIVERHASALVLFEVPYIIDDKGEIFKRWAPGDPSPTPMITGISRDELNTDSEAVTTTLLEAIALADNYRQQGLEKRAPLWEIYRELDGGFSLTAGQDAFYVKLGQGPYRETLTRLVRLLDRLKKDGNKPAIIYADNPNRPGRLTVKLKNAPPAADSDEKKKPKI